jgi:hypothetical protein
MGESAAAAEESDEDEPVAGETEKKPVLPPVIALITLAPTPAPVPLALPDPASLIPEIEIGKEANANADGVVAEASVEARTAAVEVRTAGVEVRTAAPEVRTAAPEVLTAAPVAIAMPVAGVERREPEATVDADIVPAATPLAPAPPPPDIEALEIPAPEEEGAATTIRPLPRAHVSAPPVAPEAFQMTLKPQRTVEHSEPVHRSVPLPPPAVLTRAAPAAPQPAPAIRPAHAPVAAEPAPAQPASEAQPVPVAAPAQPVDVPEPAPEETIASEKKISTDAAPARAPRRTESETPQQPSTSEPKVNAAARMPEIPAQEHQAFEPPPLAPSQQVQTSPAAAPDPAPEIAPTRPVEPVVAEPVHRNEPLRDLAFRLEGGAEPVDVRLTERGGTVHVAVHTSDPELAGTLRQNLGELETKLDARGYQAGIVQNRPTAETKNPGSDQGYSQQGSGGQAFQGRQGDGSQRRRQNQRQDPAQREKKEFSWIVSSIR